MKKIFILTGVLALLLTSCREKQPKIKEIVNPFFTEYTTPFQVPPFDQINNDHFMPAFLEGMKQQRKEVEVITGNTDAPTFANTVEALEYSGLLLRKVSDVFYNLTSSNTNEALQEIAKEVAPLISGHVDDINLNPRLFSRIQAVYDQRDSLGLTAEQYKLLENKYRDFVRGGANLKVEDQERFRKINGELSTLTLQFGDNLLKETNQYMLVIEKKEDLTGLPPSVIQAAAADAGAKGFQDKWIFTLDNPSRIPFLSYADNRELRKELFLAYINKGNHGDSKDNKEIISKIVTLRLERARMLGYPSHAHYVLEKNMAKEPAKVYELLDQLWMAALPVAKKEAEQLQRMIDQAGGDFMLQPWDWWYYAERVKKEKFNFDEEVLRPYFKLDDVVSGVFTVANKLYGLQFVERTDLPKYHPDARAFEVTEADGRHVGILFMDFFPRESKRFGAWMNNYRDQYRINGTEVSPIITVVGNFSRPAADQPSLLSFDDMSTLFHEFGHALHGLLSDCTYPSISGTSTPRDFVELPSQIMENWAVEPEVLNLFAKHYLTGEKIPEELMKSLKRSQQFNQGFSTVEYLAASYLDMDWHSLTTNPQVDVLIFEDNSMKQIGLIPEIVSRYRSTYFQHIFSGGYSSGYYSYTWAQVLDSDAFEAFRQTSLFDPATALSFRENILSKGGTEDPMVLYKRFRGSEPSIEPLLKKKGML
ncbi:MAG: M3 family metallopeptidase [Bacteroidales bacterium]|nr:M3 family metallopeptidase [Lentimicrobiaceae bacterium]MDD5695864.1 M3 family metallopeptidase [Bacteroidales bacterium]